jgi:hypothetical protein
MTASPVLCLIAVKKTFPFLPKVRPIFYPDRHLSRFPSMDIWKSRIRSEYRQACDPLANPVVSLDVLVWARFVTFGLGVIYECFPFL